MCAKRTLTSLRATQPSRDRLDASGAVLERAGGITWVKSGRARVSAPARAARGLLIPEAGSRIPAKPSRQRRLSVQLTCLAASARRGRCVGEIRDQGRIFGWRRVVGVRGAVLPGDLAPGVLPCSATSGKQDECVPTVSGYGGPSGSGVCPDGLRGAHHGCTVIQWMRNQSLFQPAASYLVPYSKGG